MKKMSKLIVLGLFLMNVVAVQAGTKKINIITTLFPQYDFTRQIVGEKGNVRNILPPGVEAHAYEPTPRDIVGIRKADIFIYTGEFMEPWAHKIIDDKKMKNLIIVDCSAGIEYEEEHSKHEEHEEEHHDHGSVDPHIWVDPIFAIKMVDNILKGLIVADAENKEYYTERAKNYKEQLQGLHEDFKDTFSRVKKKEIIYAGHFVFGYLAERYSLEYVSAYNGFSPNAEPSPRKIAEMIKKIEATGSKYVYFEELVEPKIAKVISQQTGAETLLLNGVHNVSKKDLKNGVTYIELMRKNLENLKVGLGYE